MVRLAPAPRTRCNKKADSGTVGFFAFLLARPERFELPTPKFVAWCSIQLSYGRVRSGIMW